MNIRNVINDNVAYFRDVTRGMGPILMAPIHLLNPLEWINPRKDCLGDTSVGGIIFNKKLHFIGKGAEIENWRLSEDIYAESKIERILDRYFKNPESADTRFELAAEVGRTPLWYVYDRRMAYKKDFFDIDFIDRCVQEVKRNIEEISVDQMDKWSKCSDEKFSEHCFFKRVFSREITVATTQCNATRPPGPIVDWGEEFLPVYRLAISNLEQRLERDKTSSQQGYLKNFVHITTLENKLFKLGLKSDIKSIAFCWLVVIVVPWIWKKYGS